MVGDREQFWRAHVDACRASGDIQKTWCERFLAVSGPRSNLAGSQRRTMLGLSSCLYSHPRRSSSGVSSSPWGYPRQK